MRAQLNWTRALCRGKSWRHDVFTGADPTMLRNIKALAVGRARNGSRAATLPTPAQP